MRNSFSIFLKKKINKQNKKIISICKNKKNSEKKKRKIKQKVRFNKAIITR